MRVKLPKSIFIIILIVISLSFLFLKPPLYSKARSYLVMYAYSNYEEKKSLLNKLDVSVEIPGGRSTKEKDWFPFVLVYNDNYGFSKFMERELSLTILYNFGAFDWKNGSSSYYNAESPYYNSFYGGYIIQEQESNRKYGFTPDGEPLIEEIISVPEYDFKYLVMQGLGCPEEKRVMDALSYEITSNVDYVGYNDWYRIDGLLLLNNPNHKFKSNRRAYIQFGNPINYSDKEEFGLITMHSRIYAKYFEEIGSTVFLYIMTPGGLELEKSDQEILSKTIIRLPKMGI